MDGTSYAADTVRHLINMIDTASGIDRVHLASAVELLRTHALPVSDPLAIE